jgi:hypothetical protein
MKAKWFVAIVATIIAFNPTLMAHAASGCYQLGNPKYEDLWRFCPDGTMEFSRWLGYYGEGDFTDFAAASEHDNPPCRWQSSSRSWACEDSTKLVCENDGCWPQEQ